jgi:hypothetical protein
MSEHPAQNLIHLSDGVAIRPDIRSAGVAVDPDLQDIVDEVARVSGAPVTLEDREFNLVAFAAHRTAGDAVRQDSILTRRSTVQVRRFFESFGIARAAAPVRVPPDPGRGLLGRLCVPVRWQAVTYGYLWLLEDGAPIGAALLPELAAAAGRAGIEMARRSRLRDDLGWKVGDLLSTYPETRARAAAEIAESWSLPPETPVTVVSVRAAPHGRPEWSATRPLVVNAWRLPRTVLVGSDEHGSTVIVPLSAPGDLAAARSVAHSAFGALAAPDGPDADRAVAGIGGPAARLVQARESWLQARIAARVAATGGQPPNKVLEWPDLGVHRLFGVGTDSALREAVLLPGIARLLEVGGPELARTATVYLDEAGSAQRTAQSLGIHRQTLYHRLDRIERLSGLSLRSGRDRLALHLALTLGPGLGVGAGK